MYQDKIPKADVDAIKSNIRNASYQIVFEKHQLSPLTFEPTELTIDVCQIARDILENRNDEEILIISKAIKSIHEQGRAFALALLRNDKSREQVYLSEGRELYLLSHYYDLSTVGLKQLSWSEMFAALALMQCAELSVSASQEYDDMPLSQALKQSAEMLPFIMQTEIADSIARAECLYDNRLDKQQVAKLGGQSKAENFKPLKDFVINLYLEKYTHLSMRKAGKAILKSMSDENNSLLLKSYSEDKAHDFTKWISAFRSGKYQIGIKK